VPASVVLGSRLHARLCPICQRFGQIESPLLRQREVPIRILRAQRLEDQASYVVPFFSRKFGFHADAPGPIKSRPEISAMARHNLAPSRLAARNVNEGLTRLHFRLPTNTPC